MSAPVLAIGALSVAPGEVVVLPGEDSAQKTALLETIMGFRPGAVTLFGKDVSRLAVEHRVRLGVGYVPAGRRVFAGLTVRDNIEAASSLPAGERRKRVAEMLALFPMLGERPGARAWLLSGGQQQMLALARAMVDRPRLLLLDQPTVGLATTIAQELRGHIEALAAEGVAIVIAD
jgi:branched-chain amino acid transport system ATP-binding protein